MSSINMLKCLAVMRHTDKYEQCFDQVVVVPPSKYMSKPKLTVCSYGLLVAEKCENEGEKITNVLLNKGEGIYRDGAVWIVDPIDMLRWLSPFVPTDWHSDDNTPFVCIDPEGRMWPMSAYNDEGNDFKQIADGWERYMRKKGFLVVDPKLHPNVIRCLNRIRSYDGPVSETPYADIDSDTTAYSAYGLILDEYFKDVFDISLPNSRYGTLTSRVGEGMVVRKGLRYWLGLKDDTSTDFVGCWAAGKDRVVSIQHASTVFGYSMQEVANAWELKLLMQRENML